MRTDFTEGWCVLAGEHDEWREESEVWLMHGSELSNQLGIEETEDLVSVRGLERIRGWLDLLEGDLRTVGRLLEALSWKERSWLPECYT